MDSSMKRFIAALLVPVFTLINGKWNAGIDGETQRLVVEVLAAYFLASKTGETIIENARVKARIPLEPADVNVVLNRAASEGAKLAPTVVP